MIDESLRPLLESLASWRFGLPGARETMSSASVDLVVAGRDEPSIVGLASMFRDDSTGHVHKLVDDAVEELNLESVITKNADLLVAMHVCRSVLSGALDERELSQWVHSVFAHVSDIDLLNDIALLDDDWDGAIEGWGPDVVGVVRAKVRAAAISLLELELVQ